MGEPEGNRVIQESPSHGRDGTRTTWPADERRSTLVDVPTVAQRLDLLAASNPHRLDLLTAAIAQLAPDSPSEAIVVDELDRLAARVTIGRSAGSPAGSSADPTEAVIGYVFGRLAFLGDTNYHRAANSYIHRVLARRRGIPITLAAVAVEIGRRLEVPLSVVGLPGHVVVGNGPEPSRWFDPFAGGAALDLNGCRSLFGRFRPIEEFEPAMVTSSLPATSLATRMLNNLKVSHRRSGDLSQLVQVLTVTSELPWSSPTERVELAKVLAAAGRDDQAAVVWEQLEALDPSRASAHRAAARRHRARRN
jgi:regulator of sirC expression with transglutaminase-like and TPR domain